MSTTQAFNAIIENLSTEDLAVVRSYILNTVRSEFATKSHEEVGQNPEATYEEPSRTYTLDLLVGGDSAIFNGGDITLLVDGATWEEAGRPSRIQIKATLA